MPIYTYRCSVGHQFDALVKLDGSNAPKTCPKNLSDDNGHGRLMTHSVCSQPVEKVLAPNAKLFPGADSWRK